MSYVYASADLVTFVAPDDTGLARDMGQADVDRFRSYRRVDVHWYQFLLGKMRKLKQLNDAGQMDQQLAALMTARFTSLQSTIKEHLGEAIIASPFVPPCDRYQAPQVRKGSDLFPKPRRSYPEPRITARQGMGAGPPGVGQASRESGTISPH